MASVESYTPCLLGAMDRLWFQKVVLISEPSSSSKSPITTNSPTSSPKSHTQSSSSLSSAPNSDNCSDDDDDVVEDVSHGVHELLLPTTTSTSPKSESKHEDDDKKERLEEEKRGENMKGVRPTRATLTMKKIRPSSVPIRRRTRTRIMLERTRSSKSSAELEEEEVKGFMDLGFVFDKERITPKMMSMIPGLQRLEGQDEEGEAGENGHGDEDPERRRPYLSEAWMIERQDSPIVMVRMPIVNAAANDMKKHLKLWAKTVAFSAVQHA